MRPARREGVGLEPPPELQLDIYPAGVVMTRRVHGRWRSYPVAPEAVAQALAGLPLTSGLLPPGCLGWGTAAGAPFYVQYVAPRAVALPVLAGGRRRRYRLTTPPLVWAGRGADYRIWALAEAGHPTRPAAVLHAAPFPNCYATGAICWGDADRPPAATAATLEAALACFLGSQFSLHVDNGKSRRFPASVVAQWATLTPTAPYPLDDLVPTAHTLGWLVGGGPWGGAP